MRSCATLHVFDTFGGGSVFQMHLSYLLLSASTPWAMYENVGLNADD
jgi:hypothetical protein